MKKYKIILIQTVFLASSIFSGCSQIPDTGITMCYDSQLQIACPSLGDPFYGQDAQYGTNPMNFTDNGNNTVTDNVTGLVWQQDDNNATVNWGDANTYCDDLILANNQDWRLPDIAELQYLVNFGKSNPAINTIMFPTTNVDHYWTSMELGANFEAWYLDFSDGSISTQNMYTMTPTYARCVRGNSANKVLYDIGNGTILEYTTGLIWQQQDDNIQRSWQGALAYCEGLQLAGSAEWKLPDVKELLSIVDYNNQNPTIDTSYFPGTNNSDYWTSSTLITNSNDGSSAWSINFGNGYTTPNIKSDGPLNLVRCVRTNGQ